jgi:hypothetical protein
MHPVTRSLLVDVIQKAAKERGAPFTSVWKYWISFLMLSLQVTKLPSEKKLFQLSNFHPNQN